LLGNWEDGDCKRSRDWATQSQVVWELGVRVDDQGDREKSRFHNSLWRRKVEVREKKNRVCMGDRDVNMPRAKRVSDSQIDN
jgi:hypothetical protein